MATDTARAPAPAAPLPVPEPGRVPEWVMLARTGRWRGHPTVPEVIEPEHLRSALDYFRRHYAANGTELVIDYHHASVAAPAARAPAAGWVRRMELRNDDTELWGRVTWTTPAARGISGREYRYLSPVFRFDHPDRLTGRPVPLHIHSVALTNTPFLTELESLNSDPAAPAPPGPGDGTHDALTKGDADMTVLESVAAAAGIEPAELADRLNVQPDAEDPAVARTLLERGEPGDVCPAIANALGAETALEPTEAGAAVMRLKASAAALRQKLGLPEDAPEQEVLNSIDALQAGKQRSEAERLVERAVREGRIPPAHRGFYLREALNDPEAARRVINSMPVLTAPQPKPGDPPADALTEGERAVCRQLGLEPEQMAAARTNEA
ncbi:MAG: phage protease [Planctomycetota bacterium]